MNLEDFFGRTVSVRFMNGESNSNCTVCKNKGLKGFYLDSGNEGPVGTLTQGPYSHDGKYCFSHEGPGGRDIVSIEPVFTGLAQARPGIDLEDFVDKTVLIYLNECGYIHFGYVTKRGMTQYDIGYFTFTRDGARVTLKGQYIERIYDQDSFMVCTKPLPDTNPELDELAQKLKTLSESDIAKLLHSIKK